MNLLDALPAAAILTVCLANAWRDDRRDLYSLRRNARRRAAATAASGTPASARAAIGTAEAHGSPHLPD